MTRSRKMIVLVLCIVALVVVYIAIDAWSQKAAEKEENAFYMTAFDPDEITALSWEYSGESFRLEKSSDEDGNQLWINADDEDFNVDQESAAAMVYIVSEIPASRILKNTDDYSQYGLYENQAGIVIETEDGSAYEILTGDYNDVSYEYYAMVKGEKDVFMVEGTYLDSFECTMEDMRAEEAE